MLQKGRFPMATLTVAILMTTIPYSLWSQTLSVDVTATRMRRQTITGATIIVHGYQFNDSGGDSLMPLATDIHNTIQNRKWLLDYDIVSNNWVGQDGGNAVFDTNQSIGMPGANDQGQTGHLVLLFDWAPESNERNHGWTEAAGDALFALLIHLGVVNVQHGTNAPMHFIGHSFGCAVVSECVERLAHYNVPVAHVTYLDPHDFDQPIRDSLPHLTRVDTGQRQWTVGKPNGYGAAVWNNVEFADCYYQTRGVGGGAHRAVDVPNGRPIPGAYNHWVNTELPAQNPNPYGFSDSDHSYVWNCFYRGTVLGRLPNGCPTPQQAPNWNATGWSYSQFSGRNVGRPLPGFYTTPQEPQNHRYSVADLVDRTTGQPNRNGLNRLGILAIDIDAARWKPVWQRTEIVNGNFSATGTRASNDIVPGWSHHGGGGDGDADAPGYMQLNWNDDDRTHNRLYIPPNATNLKFKARRARSGDDTLRLSFGSTELWTLAMNATDANFVAYTVALPAQFPGTVDTLKFEVTDNPGGWSWAVNSEVRLDDLEWTVRNRPPVAANDSYTTQQNQPINVPPQRGVLANDTDPDREPLRVQLTSQPTNGTLVMDNNTGAFTYTPNQNFNGEDQFKYRAVDTLVASNEAVVKITVNPPPNRRPQARNDQFQTGKNALLTVNSPGVRENDSDADGHLILSQLLSLPTHGTLYYLDETGSFLYQPDQDFTGSDAFTYWVTDGFDVSDPATVRIDVVNLSPTGNDDTYTMLSISSVQVPAPGVLANDRDPEDEPMTTVLLSSTTQGTLNLNPDGSFDYMPWSSTATQDQFTYQAMDASGAVSSPVTVTIQVFDRYRVTDLGVLPGASDGIAQRINDRGQVIGYSTNPNRGFIWDNGTLTDMGGGYAGVIPFEMNNALLVCGLIEFGGGQFHAFLWQDGIFADLGTLGGALAEALGMNEFGQVVGDADLPDGSWHATLWDNGSIIDLGVPDGYVTSVATGINNKDQIAGYATDASGIARAFRFEEGLFTDLGTLPGDTWSYARGINDAGQISGTSSADANNNIAHAFLWDNGAMTDLGSLYGLSSYARRVNNSAQVVGTVGNGNQRRAFLWQGGVMVNLNDYLCLNPGWTLMVARDINNAAQIVGWGRLNGENRAFLLTPFCCTPGNGDTNGDGCVDDADLAAVIFEFGGPESGAFGHTDQNCNGITDDADLAIVIFNFGTGC